MGWLITFGILFLLAILPLGASVIYDSDGVLIRVIAGLIRIKVFPLPRKEKKPEKPKKKKPKKTEGKPRKEKKTEKPPKKGGSFLDFLPLVKVGVDFLDGFRRKIRVNCLTMHITLAGEDPCDLAVNYGRTWAALGNLQPLLERVFVIRKRDLDVNCDFMSSDTRIYARLDITITLGRIITLAVVAGIRALIVFLKIKKKRKGGAVK